MTAKEWHYSRYVKGMDDNNGVLDGRWEDMDAYAKQQAVDFEKWRAEHVYHKNEMTNFMQEFRGDNDYAVPTSYENIFIKNAEDLYDYYIKHK